MDQQNQVTNSSVPVEPPMKRKRGRPRKDESQVKRERITKSNSMSDAHRLGANRSNEDNDDDEMVGQVVSGVCEGAFDAGYFVTVKVGNTDTLLRGAVFVPGLFTPISAANDVAPHAKMYKRKEIPIPVLSPQAQGSSSAPRLRRKNKQPVLPEIMTPVAVDQAPSSDAQCGTSMSIKTNSTSTNIPVTYNVPKNDNVSSLAEVSCSLFVPQDEPASDKVPLTDSFPKIETVLPSGGRVQGQISTPDVAQKVFPTQLDTLFSPKDQCPSVMEPNNEADISLGEKVRLENQIPVVADPVLTPQHHIGALRSPENTSVAAPLTGYLPKNDTNLPLEEVVPIENRVPIAANQALPILQFGAPLSLEDSLSSDTSHPIHDLLKDDRVMPEGEKFQDEKELPMDKAQVLLSDHPCGAAFAVENQSASPVTLSGEKLPGKDDGFTLEAKDMPQETLELGLGDQPVSLTELKSFHKIIKPAEMFQEIEPSTLAKGPEVDAGIAKELKLDAESRTYVDVFPGGDTVIQMTQVQQAVSPADEPKGQHHELHLDPVIGAPEYMPFQLIDKPVDVRMENQVCLNNVYSQQMQSEFTVKDLFGSNTSFQSNRSPFDDALNVTGEKRRSSPKPILQPMMNFPGEAEQTKLKLGAEGPETLSIFESQISHSVGPAKGLDSGSLSIFESQISHSVNPAKGLDSGFKDAIISAKIEINAVAATSNAITSEDVSQTEDDAQRAEA